MDDKKRGDDAQDHAPEGHATEGHAPEDHATEGHAAKDAPTPAGGSSPPAGGRQDAPNYDERTDGGRAVKVEDLSSANDEGAN